MTHDSGLILLYIDAKNSTIVNRQNFGALGPFVNFESVTDSVFVLNPRGYFGIPNRTKWTKKILDDLYSEFWRLRDLRHSRPISFAGEKRVSRITTGNASDVQTFECRMRQS